MRQMKRCLTCNKEFLARQAIHVHCSIPCRQRAYRESQKQRNPNHKKQWYANWVKKNPDKALKAKEQRVNRASALREYIWDIKRKMGCKACNESRTEVLCFHHRDITTKEAEINRCRTRTLVDLEVAKCDVLCMNCHTALHYWEGKSKKKAVC